MMVRYFINSTEYIDLSFIQAGTYDGTWSIESHIKRSESHDYNAAITGIEALLVATANNRINLAQPALHTAVTEAVQAIKFQYGQ